MKKIPIFFLISFISLLLFINSKVLIISDLTIQPIVNSDELNASTAGVYLVSYADGKELFLKNQNTLAASAINKGVDFIFNYRKNHIDPEFAKKYAHILNKKRGAGYWLWKPWVILKTLESVPEGAIVVYSDGGFAFRKPLYPLIELAKKQDIILIQYNPEIYYYPSQITKREALMRMNCDKDQCRKGTHIWAGFSIFRNSPASRDFVKKWLDYCCDERILTDIPSNVSEHPEFLHHQHDEAVLSALYNKEPKGKYLIPETELFSYVLWHHRQPGQEYETLLPALYRGIKGIERKILNSSWMVALRRYVVERFL